MNKKKAIILFAFVVLILIIVIAIGFYLDSRNKLALCEKKPQFELLSPEIAWKGVDEFLEEQKELKVSYSGMKQPLVNIINNTRGQYGIYFEDLTTGAWLGVNEKEQFIPVSLIKLPLLVAVLKRVEKGDLILEQNITLKEEFLDSKSGTLYKKGEGYNISVKDMLIYLIEESDNTAFYTLIDLVSEEEFETARVAMGLPNLKDPSAISPRDYANMLRSLYLSTYLRRTFSEVALSLMINTDFDSGLPSGVPKSVKVAHKVGFSVSKGYFHDCGIIYDVHSDNIHPYILCVMSKNSTQQEANKVISNVSKTVYDYRHNNELS